MNKREIIEALNAEHRALLSLVQVFSPKDFEQTAGIADWSVKDLFGHIAYWNGEAARAIEQVARNQRPVMMLDKDDAAINAREIGERRALPLHRIMDEYRRAHLALAGALQRTDESELHRKTAHFSADGKHANAAWIAGGILEHCQEHRAGLEHALR